MDFIAEELFLIKLTVDKYNEQYRKNYSYSSFCIKSITPAYQHNRGYELIRNVPGSFLILHVYFLFTNKNVVRNYRLEVHPTLKQGVLGDEIYVALGEIDNFYLEEKIYKFNTPINTCGDAPEPVETFYLLQENGDRYLTEDGSFILLEASP